MQNITIHFISYFLSSEFTETVLMIFVDIVFATFVDTISVAFIISSCTISITNTF